VGGGGAAGGAGVAEAGGGDGEAEAAAWGLVRRTRRMHFLDVGANSRGSLCLDPRVLAAVAPQLHLTLHGTPRQWSDASRPWIHEEKERCLRLCREAGLSATQRLYFPEEKPCVAMHFRVLDAFDAEA
jgi:hypothetical protein